MKRAIFFPAIVCMVALLASCADRKPAPTQNYITNRLKMQFVYVPPGSFLMGSPSNETGRFDDETLHKVKITKGFYMQTTEVTQRQWETVMHANPSRFKSCGYNCPVENVSWNDVQQFIRKLNKLEPGKRYRLPTEAEWEYACRLGAEKNNIVVDSINIVRSALFPKTDCLPTDIANYDGNFPLKGCPAGKFRGTTTPAGSFPPSDIGLYDMDGNVYEWCNDIYGPYPDCTVTDPKGAPAGKTGNKGDIYRVFKGGSWYSSARYCRAAYRGKEKPDYRYCNIGFRLVMEP